ncbi:MAG: response regulator transcription factor [Bacteroidales bacterium]|nr:response regulator transcription factor [Bacteroidales bacterium]
MEKIRVIIADDETHALNNLEYALKEFKEIEISAKTTKSIEVINLVRTLKPDLIFLDINMPQISGLEVVDELQSLAICPYVVLVTAHVKYSLDAYNRFVFNFLLKPIDPIQLHRIINRFSLIMAKQPPIQDKLNFKCKSGFILISPKDIMGFKADGNYTEIYLNNGKIETVVMQLGKIEKMLNSENYFRSGRSCIVNLDYLSHVNKLNSVLLLSSGSINQNFNISDIRMKIIEEILLHKN